MTDTLMIDRPLWMDVSSYQSFLDMDKAKAAGNDVLGVIIRAGVGLNKDVDFQAFWTYYQDKVAWQSSYWANHPQYLPGQQSEKWFEQNPELILNISRMVDAERHNNMPPHEVASHIVSMSNDALVRDGQRPMMYGAYYFLMEYLIPFVSEEWLNEHWFILAQYNDGDAIEDETSLMLPDKIHIDRVVFQQTTGVAELYPGSGAVDRLRFLLGDIEEMRAWARQFSGLAEVEPVEHCCLAYDIATESCVVHPAGLPVDPCSCVDMADEIEEMQGEMERLLLTNEQLYGRIGTLETAFRAHSTRQVIWKKGVTVTLGRLSLWAHSHPQWMDRFFTRGE